MKIIKRSIFGDKNISPNQLYKPRKLNEKSYQILINNFTDNQLVKNLLYEFVHQNTYNIRSSNLKDQLELLSNLTLDDQLKVLNKTLTNKWKSLVPAYEVLERSKSKRFDNVSGKSISKQNSNNIDIVSESF